MAMTDEQRSAVKSRAAEWLLRIPGVTGVGLGSKEVDDRPTGELVIKVFVREKRSLEEIPAEERIPAEIEGLRTDVVVGGDVIRIVDPPGAIITRGTEDIRYRPLLGGGHFRRAGAERGGTMGCVLRDLADPTRFYGLTNHHVVDLPEVAPLVAGTSRAGQPTGKSSASRCCDDLVGTYIGGAETPDRDEALVRLDPGIQFQAEVLEIGPITGTHTISQGEALPGTYKVRKRGSRTRLTGGTVRAVEMTTGAADNRIVVKPNAHPAPGTQTVFFAFEGDSGSVLLNEAAEIVGLVFGRDDAGNGYALPIANVVTRFFSSEGVTVDVVTSPAPGTVTTVPGSAMVTLPPEVAPVLRPSYDGAGPLRVPVGMSAPPGALVAEPRLALAGVQRDLDRSETGRLLITLWLRHQEELLALVNANQRVAAVWHRSGAAALGGTLARMIERPELPLPETLHGRPLTRVLEQMHEVLARFGSTRLRDDLARARAVLPDPAGLTYPQLIAALGGG